MCGRTCLTLAPDEICLACGKPGSDGKKQKLPWRNEYNLGRKYEGHLEAKGYNIAPQDITPVLVSGEHFKEKEVAEKHSEKTIIVPMLWGIIPRWHKGDYRKHGLTTNNCRLEGLSASKLYHPLLKAGNRCVVLCEGFYEWQTTNSSAKSSERKVYFIHFPQEKHIKMEDKTTWTMEDIKLFKVAGLFDKWTDENGDTMYSYTIITFESDATLNWLHHRTPAVLETEQQVDDWLDFQRVPEKDALKLLTQPKDLVWYQVSNFVNNSRNKSQECNKPLAEKTKTPKSKMMQMWLKKAEPKSEKRSPDQHKDENESKKQKL